MMMQKTWNAKPGEVERRWYLVDAEGKTLGRLATQIADTLRGKGKPEYTPHVDTGDFVVVVNAEKIAVTGNKLDDKIYYRHSGYPGGLKERPLRDELARRPTEVLRKAVKGMLPRNRLARAQTKAAVVEVISAVDRQPLPHLVLHFGGVLPVVVAHAPAFAHGIGPADRVRVGLAEVQVIQLAAFAVHRRREAEPAGRPRPAP